MSYQHIVVDDPRPRVRRITLNRPEKRNALNNRLRGEIFEVLEAADRDPEISISVLRGAGPCFSAGYDLSADNKVDQPYHSASGPGQWSRLEQRTLDFAERAAKVPVELQQLNKRSVHRAMEIMGARAAMRAGTEIQALAFTTEASRNYMSTFRRDGGSVKRQLDQRDTTFGDYGTKKE